MAERRPIGALVELEVGAPAQGGACVARIDGRVGFVRHALPGERVLARVTEDRGGSYFRADAVEIRTASPDRVRAPCRFAGPGACGGCDWQHVAGPAQREFKAALIREQFARLGGIELGTRFAAVEELPGGLLGWRRRIAYAVDDAGRPGLRRHRSHEIEPVDRCLLGAAGIGDAALLADRWSGLSGIEAVRGDGPGVAVLAHRPGGGKQPRGRRPPDRVTMLAGPRTLHHESSGRGFEVAADGFWQVHPAAAEAYAAALLAAVEPRPGERVLDLYAGAGALTAALAQPVGPGGRVVGLESAPGAVADARANLADLPWAQVRRERVTPEALRRLDLQVDVVVLDPPRAGAGRELIEAILALRPRVVGYLSCDPATLARDVAAAARSGWAVQSLRAFDAFPMTRHVECLATLAARHPDNPGTGP